MLVIMTCCNSHYADVKASMNHECPSDNTETFETILDLEFAAGQAKNETRWAVNPNDVKGMHDEMVTRLVEARKEKAKELQEKLFAAIDALTDAQRIEFARYRAAKK